MLKKKFQNFEKRMLSGGEILKNKKRKMFLLFYFLETETPITVKCPC